MSHMLRRLELNNLQNGAVFRTAADHFADCEPTEPRDFYQYMVDLPDPNDMPDPGNATLPANSYHKLPAALDNLAVYARLRQLLDCP